MRKCAYSPLQKRGEKSGTSKGKISSEGYNQKTTYKENKSGEKVKRKELTKVRHKDEHRSDATIGPQKYTPETDYTTTLKKYNRKGELKKTKTVSGGSTKKHEKLRKKYYRGNKKVKHTT
jgi:hypothetical protein